jgi:hypothetical protein
MELIHFDPQNEGSFEPRLTPILASPQERKPFIEANTVAISLDELRTNHIVPVFRCGEPLISQANFIEATYEVVQQHFQGERVSDPMVRISHETRGRVPSALSKKATELEPHEMTVYYSRMAFVIEVPTLCDNVNGQTLSLVIGGVRAYDKENLTSRKGNCEHFKIFCAHTVRLCTNLCISCDGLLSDLKVTSIKELKAAINELVSSFDAGRAVRVIDRFTNYSLSESQFAQVVGKCKLYQHLPSSLKGVIYDFPLGDAQLTNVVKQYFQDEHFGKDANGAISLWGLYNMLTQSNKSSYIDSILERGSTATTFIDELATSIERRTYNWFLA